MHITGFSSATFCTTARAQSAVPRAVFTLFFILASFSVLVTAQPVYAQTYTVLHQFTGAGDGGVPAAGLTFDATGNLYGTTEEGGYFGNRYCSSGGCGTVFKLTPNNGSWIETVLHAFTGVLGGDGEFPSSEVVFGPDGQLYGATGSGGNGSGTVFSLAPSTNVCKTTSCPWTETVLLSPPTINCYGEGINGDVTFDQAGNLYDTNFEGGDYSVGDVFRLESGYGWICGTLHFFNWNPDGGNPASGVLLLGNLIYGTTSQGGQNGYGTLYSLVPFGALQVLHAFANAGDGAHPWASPISDTAGNLYGTAGTGGAGGGGTVFEWSAAAASFRTIYSFPNPGSPGPLTLDPAGNLYGTLTWGGSYGKGAVYKLTHTSNGWIYNSLHDFSGSEGMKPNGKVILDAHGNLYGTANSGGTYGYGVVWQITR